MINADTGSSHYREWGAAMTTLPEMAYVAFHSCGGWVFVAVDTPDRRKENARDVARCIRVGLTVEHGPVDDIRRLLIQVCRCKKERR